MNTGGQLYKKVNGKWEKMDWPTSQTTELPPGYRVLNDGPGREVLTHDSWETGNVFDTVAQAAAFARWLEGPADLEGCN
jgi:hypothetical protein